jgi:hypothetical protein
MFLAAVGCLAAAIGMARSGRGADAGYAPRYVTLAVPVLYCLYFVWELYGTANARRLVQMVFFTLICMLFPLDVQQTLQRGEDHGQQMAAVEKDVAAGTSPAVLAERYGSFLYDPDRPETLAAYLRMLHRARIGPFRLLRDDSEIVSPVRGGDQEAGDALIDGRFELIDKDQIVGWVWDKRRPDRPLGVEIYDGERLLETRPADQFRQDLLDAGIGNGKHAFCYPTPAGLKDGKPHTVRVKASGTELVLSPQTVTFD